MITVAPQKRDLSLLAAELPAAVGTFVCCASYESRCLSIAKNLPAARVEHALIVESSSRNSLVTENATELASHFAGKATRVVANHDSPLKTADAFREALASSCSAVGQTVVDITTFTHEHLLILLAMLKAVRPGHVTLVYTGAAQYMTGADKWLSRGIGSIRSILGYPGALRPSQEIHLLVLVGFELERAQRLIDVYEPALVSLGYGAASESIAPQHHSLNLGFHRNLATRLKNVHEFEFSCRHAEATADAIRNQIRKFPGYASVVAPLNTKVSTVGAGIVAVGDADVQLCYAQPEKYNCTEYSTPDNTFYFVEAPGLF